MLLEATDAACSTRFDSGEVLGFKNVEDAQISPDGTQVAFVVGDSCKVDTKWSRSTVWLASLAANRVRLPAGRAPTRCHAGRRLAFLLDRLHAWFQRYL